MTELRWILLGCGAVLLFGIFLWGRRTRGQAANGDELGMQAQGRVEPPILQQGPVPSIHSTDVSQSVTNRWQDDEWSSTVADLPEIRLHAQQAFDEPFVSSVDEEAVLLPVHEDILSATDRSDRPPARRNPVQSAAPVAPPDPPREGAQARPKVTDKRKIVALRLIAVPPERYQGFELLTALQGQGLQHGRYGIFHRLDASGVSFLSVASMVEPGAFDLATMADTAFAGITLFTMLPGPLPAEQTCEELIACARQLEQALGGVLHDERGAPLTAQKIATLRDEMMNFEHLLGPAGAAPQA